MDFQPQNQQPYSDDQELAKVLAGVNGQNDGSGLDFEESGVPAVAAPANANDGQTTTVAVEPPAVPADIVVPTPPAVDQTTINTSVTAGQFDDLKATALEELRPLVDKLNVPADERFDLYLLLIRSTDDGELLTPAHDAARQIEDESRRAQALLDIIKEIDYLSGRQN